MTETTPKMVIRKDRWGGWSSYGPHRCIVWSIKEQRHVLTTWEASPWPQ